MDSDQTPLPPLRATPPAGSGPQSGTQGSHQNGHQNGPAQPPPAVSLRIPRVMSWVTHLAYGLAYLIAGGVVGFTLPFVRPGTDALVGWLTGTVVVLAGLMLHQILARLDRGRYERELATWLRDHAERTDSELARLRHEVARLFALLETARGGGASNYDAVMQEVKLLQSLVAKLHEKRSGASAEAPTAEVARTAAPPAPSRRGMESGGPLIGQQAPPIALPPGSGNNTAVARRNDAVVLEMVREALRADRIDIYLQPVVSLPQRKHRFYEVFSRVRGPDGSQIMPDRYIDIAAREGLIATIDNLLLMRCMQLIRETEKRQHHVAFFSNISAATLGDADFMRQFLQILSQNQGLVPKLVFELGQADLRDGGAVTSGVLSQLAKLGLRFSMDQVTDLNLDVDALIRADFRYIKLDCGLLLDPESRPRADALRRRAMGQPIDIVVEKIETENQLIEVLDMGIDFGQGFLFGEPRLSKKPG